MHVYMYVCMYGICIYIFPHVYVYISHWHVDTYVCLTYTYALTKDCSSGERAATAKVEAYGSLPTLDSCHGSRGARVSNKKFSKVSFNVILHCDLSSEVTFANF